MENIDPVRATEQLKRDIRRGFEEIDEVIAIPEFVGMKNIDTVVKAYLSDLRDVGKIHEITEMRRYDETKPHYKHSIRVGGLSWIALKYLGPDFVRYIESELDREFGPDELSEYLIGGILHDGGKLKIKKGILVKPGRLTPEEFEEIKSHREHGVTVAEEILKEDGIRAPIVKAIVYGHHNNYEHKNGYDKVLDLKKFNGLVELVALADNIDAPFFRGIYQRKCRPNDLFNYIRLISTADTPENQAMIIRLTDRVNIVLDESGQPYFRNAKPGRFAEISAAPYKSMLLDFVRD